MLLYFFCMGAPLFLFYTLYTLRARVLPNWIAPSVVPFFALLALLGDSLWREGTARQAINWLTVGLVVGYSASAFVQATELTAVLTGHYLPAKLDPLHRVRQWKEIALMLGRERDALLPDGQPVFFIAQHYGLASILTFYLPEAKKASRASPSFITFEPIGRRTKLRFFRPGYTM